MTIPIMAMVPSLPPPDGEVADGPEFGEVGDSSAGGVGEGAAAGGVGEGATAEVDEFTGSVGEIELE